MPSLIAQNPACKQQACQRYTDAPPRSTKPHSAPICLPPTRAPPHSRTFWRISSDSLARLSASAMRPRCPTISAKFEMQEAVIGCSCPRLRSHRLTARRCSSSASSKYCRSCGTRTEGSTGAVPERERTEGEVALAHAGGNAHTRGIEFNRGHCAILPLLQVPTAVSPGRCWQGALPPVQYLLLTAFLPLLQCRTCSTPARLAR